MIEFLVQSGTAPFSVALLLMLLLGVVEAIGLGSSAIRQERELENRRAARVAEFARIEAEQSREESQAKAEADRARADAVAAPSPLRGGRLAPLRERGGVAPAPTRATPTPGRAARVSRPPRREEGVARALNSA